MSFWLMEINYRSFKVKVKTSFWITINYMSFKVTVIYSESHRKVIVILRSRLFWNQMVMCFNFYPKTGDYIKSYSPNRQTDRHTDRRTHRQTDTQTVWQHYLPAYACGKNSLQMQRKSIEQPGLSHFISPECVHTYCTTYNWFWWENIYLVNGAAL